MAGKLVEALMIDPQPSPLIKSPEQQSAMMLHRICQILNRQRTQLSNARRAHLAEFWIAAPIGRNGIKQLLDVIADPADERVPADAWFCLEMLAARPPADGDTRRRPTTRQRHRRHRARSRDLPLRPQPCRVDRLGAAA